tara:strand:+ start:2732 stop:3589 length:858 start_codon:yes stop_codon:yes gene_type:complete
MSRNSSGTYSLPNGVNPVVNGTLVSAQWANPTMADIANALTNSLDRNGKGGMLAQFNNASGTVSLPGITWSSETDSGFFRNGTGDWRSTINGVVTAKHIDQSLVTRGERQPFQVWDGSAFYSPMTTDGGHTPQFKDLTSEGKFLVTAGGVTVTTNNATISAGGGTIDGASAITGNIGVSGTTTGYAYDPDWTYGIIKWEGTILGDNGITSVVKTGANDYTITFDRNLNSATAPMVVATCVKDAFGTQCSAVIDPISVNSIVVYTFSYSGGGSSSGLSIYANTPAV